MTQLDTPDLDSTASHPVRTSRVAAVAPVMRRQSVGRHLLYRGDCVKVMNRLAAESVDVVVTSPPYNIGLSYR
ncbi:MAG: hypothetical protein ACRYFY_21320, partial [Janthinobacterium lividum]